MVNLIASSPFGEALPIVVGGLTLSPLMPEAITSVTPLRGQEKTVSAALKNTHGLAFPAPNRATGKDGARCVWVGPGQALLLGAAVSVLAGAAVTDQSDGWAVMRLEGAACEDVLARLVPVDLRGANFRRGHTAKTLLYHMPLSITRVAPAAFDLMVFRSMAATAVHELEVAMKSLAARR